MLNNRMLAFLGIILFVTQSCGGGGGTSEDTGPMPQTDSLSGVASKGPISGATVRVYRINADGSLGTLIAQTTTNTTGAYTLEFDAQSTPVVVRVTAGSYFDEQSGNAVNLSSALDAVVDTSSTGTAAVTPLTLIAARMALASIESGAEVEDAVDAANQTIADYFGLDDILSAPTDLTATTANATSNGAKYGAILAGIAVQASTLGVAADVLAAAMASDGADGVFDGESDGNAVAVGATALPSDSAQAELAAGIESFLNSARNASGVTAGQLSALTDQIENNPASAIELVSLSVTPTSDSIVIADTTAFTATATYSNGTTSNLTSSVTWTSSNISIATINSSGVATGVDSGSVTITATDTDSGESDTATLTVTAELTSITVSPASPDVEINDTQNFTATGTYSDNSTQNITSSVTWTSSNTSVATINSSGVATGRAAGTATITATLGSISNTATLTVNPATLQSITVSPSAPSIEVNDTQAFTATGSYSDSSTQDLSSSVTWDSSDDTVATIASGGTATGHAAGSATITATLGAISDTATLTVTAVAPTLDSIAITPGDVTIGVSASQNFTVLGTYSDNSTEDLTTSVTWSSSNTSIASIGASTGVASSSGSTGGTVTITASLGSIEDEASLTVEVSFALNVLPLFTSGSSSCLDSGCHPASGAATNGLRMNSHANIMAGATSGSGAVVVAFDSTNSGLVARISSTNISFRMPRNKTALTSTQIALIRSWIDQGAENN